MATPPNDIGAPPAVPDRSNQQQFNTTIQSWWGWIKSFYQYTRDFSSYLATFKNELNSWLSGLPVEDAGKFKHTTGDIHLDPNTAIDIPHILTDHPNSPGAGYWYISTLIYSDSDHRRQIAVSHTRTPTEMYVRNRYSGEWRPWARVDNFGLAAENGDPTKPFRVATATAGNEATNKSQLDAISHTIGTNANGSYIKFEDGTLIQWGDGNDGSDTTELGSLWRGGYQIRTFPVAFVGEFSVTASSADDTNIWFTTGGLSSTSFGSRKISTSDIGTYVKKMSWIAIGRWK